MTTASVNQVVEVGLLLYPGAQASAVHGLTDLFQVANRMAGQPLREHAMRIRLSHWQQEGATPRRVFDSHPGQATEPRFILLPPCLEQHRATLLDPSLCHWLRQQHQAGVTLGSVCAGAFALAEAGLLDRRPATTHWALADELARRFPSIRVDASRMIVDDSDIITAGGLMAWTDLGLMLVARLLGPTVASETARFLVVDQPRESQQAFSGFVPRLDHGDSRILSVQHWLRQQPRHTASLAQMAAHAGLGERTFLRRFNTATGLKPSEYCQQLRVAKAREWLEFSSRSIDAIAWEVGYRDPGAFRKVFNKLVGLSPGEYRRRFSPSRASQVPA